MDKEITEAQILEEIHKNSKITQRALSRKVGIALGVCNSYIRRMINKGYLKVTTMPRKRLKYFLTPSGIKRKIQLTYEYMNYSMKFYKEARERAKELLTDLKEKNKTRIAFLGVGSLAEIIYLTIQGMDLEFIAVFDDEKAGQKFFKTTVLEESKIREIEYDALIFTRPEWAEEEKYSGDLEIISIF